MNWAPKRKFMLTMAVFLAAFIPLSVFIYLGYFNHAPTCFDNVINQDERGVDCGGVCALLCPDESRSPIVVYDRLFSVGYGTYSAFALVENVNQGVYSKSMDYVFKVYDKDNILLTEARGSTFVPPGRIFPIFEHSIQTGNREAVKVTFEVDSPNIVWKRGVFIDPGIHVANISNTEVDSRQRVSVDIENDEVYAMRDVPIVVVVYDEDGNARGASSSIIEYLSPKDKVNLSFTWNHKFDFNVSKIDIVPRAIPREWGERNF
jgi:hypothetical protein